MNLMTDELKDRFQPTDLPVVQKEIETVEMMHLRWTLNMALGQIEDAQGNSAEELRSTQRIQELADKAEHSRMMTTTMDHLKLLGIVVKRR